MELIKDDCNPLKSWVMKKDLHIMAIIDHPGFLEDIVEKLAIRHRYGYRNQQIPFDRNNIETSSTETYVNGTMVIEHEGEHINMPFITCFLFTCIKQSADTYSLEWGISLS